MFPMYDPVLIQPMRDEVTAMGVQELLSASDVDVEIAKPGTVLVFVNSVCGCAAGGARPGLRLALQGPISPDRVVSVFAGQDREATSRAREYFLGYAPSSPSFALFRNGRLMQMLERHQIEGRTPEMIASALATMFDVHCTAQPS